MALSDEDIGDAEARMAERLDRSPRVVRARFDRAGREIVLALSDGSRHAFSPDAAEALRQASPEDLDSVEISPSGLGLHWPALDADLYVPAILEGLFGPRAQTDHEPSVRRREPQEPGRPRRRA